MGDALCLMPTLRLIKQHYPKSQLIWLTTQRCNPSLFTDLPFIDAIQMYPLNHRLLTFLYRWKKQGIDICIDFDQYYHISHLFALLCQQSYGFATTIKKQRLTQQLSYDHQMNEKLLFLKLAQQALNLPKINYSATLSQLIPAQPSKQAQSLSKNLSKTKRQQNIIIYPGSSGNAEHRRWPLQRFIALAKHLMDQGHRVIIAGGFDELNLVATLETQMANACSVRYINLIGKLSLPDWLWLMHHHSDLFIGNDAGLLHIAEAANVPILGIFGPNISSKWGSLNPASRHLEINAAELTCRPCIQAANARVPNHCARGDLACLKRISVEQVLTTACEMLSVPINVASMQSPPA